MSLVTQKCRLEWEEGIENLQVLKERDSISSPLYHAFFNLPFFPHTPLPLLCLLHSPPLRFYFTISLVFLHIFFFSISRSLCLLCGVSSARREWAGLEDRGFSSFSPTHERTAARHRRPWLWNRFSLQIVCASRRVFVSLSPTSSSHAAAGVGCWKERHVKVR